VSFIGGLDIGGTKIAGAAFDAKNVEIAQIIRPTPESYSDLVTTCADIVRELDQKCAQPVSVGVGVPGSVDNATGIVPVAANTPCLTGKPLQPDLEKILGRPVRLANDADCAALSEAVDGAGQGFATVLGLIMGTGVGSGFIVNGQIIGGANGLTGEFGHIVVPFREASDGPYVECICGQKGCIDKSINGPALSRLYKSMTRAEADPVQIQQSAQRGDKDALHVLDQFYTVVAKAMIVVIHTFDPDVIVVSGGLNTLPGMYDEVPKRWERYAMYKNLKTKFVPAKYGAMSGLRGAAWLGRN
jgi:fructokinase